MIARLAARFNSLPVRWRLALTSAGLTFAILLLFAVTIAVFSGREVRQDFDDDLRAAASELQSRIRVRPSLGGGLRLVADARDLVDVAGAGNAFIRVTDRDGDLVAATPNAPELGPPVGELVDAGPYRVATRPLRDPLGEPVAYVQYAKPRGSVDATVSRLRLLLGLGVLGGSALALLAGLAVARRAMAPIAALTAAAQGIARTRDPRVRLPVPAAEDEVADLSRTLEEMLMALDAARGETEAALARQREFVADASHELRTPLTSILANLELLEHELTAGPEGPGAEIAGSALRSSRRMRRLVADLLLLARADAGRAAAPEPVELADVVREAAGEAAALAVDHELSVDAPGGMRVLGSRDELHRLALNLIENALVHTPPGTAVTVSVRSDDGEALLEVADAGPGVPAELRERLFERFVRGAGDRAGAGGGSGLGLAIVRAVAETHGGSVSLEQAARGGARFVVRLPVSGVPAPVVGAVGQRKT